MKDQQCSGLGQCAVFAMHLAFKLIVFALQIAQRGVGLALLGKASSAGLRGSTEGLAPLDQLVLEQAFLTAPGMQRGAHQCVAFIQRQQTLRRGPMGSKNVARQVCRMWQPCPCWP